MINIILLDKINEEKNEKLIKWLPCNIDERKNSTRRHFLSEAFEQVKQINITIYIIDCFIIFKLFIILQSVNDSVLGCKTVFQT